MNEFILTAHRTLGCTHRKWKASKCIR